MSLREFYAQKKLDVNRKIAPAAFCPYREHLRGGSARGDKPRARESTNTLILDDNHHLAESAPQDR